jgi:hypothetical protein
MHESRDHEQDLHRLLSSIMTTFLMKVTIHMSASFIVDSLLQDNSRSGLEVTGRDWGTAPPPKWSLRTAASMRDRSLF